MINCLTCFWLASLPGRGRVGVAHLSVPACAFVSARHVLAPGGRVAGTGLAAS